MKISSVCIIFFIAILLSGLTSTATTWAASADEIDAKANAVPKKFYQDVGAAKELAKKSKGILIFPQVVKAGFVIGGNMVKGLSELKTRQLNITTRPRVLLDCKLAHKQNR